MNKNRQSSRVDDEGRTAQLEAIAWNVLADLLTPDGAFARYDPEGLEQLIRMRIAEEAERAGVSAVELMHAFQRAMSDLTGPRHAPSDEPEGPDEPNEA